MWLRREMRKRFIYLFISSLIFLLSFASFNLTFAQEIASEEETASPSSETKEIKYELPYPGLLPDSPLYFLRILRDRIVSFLISDPLKKSEFNLLQADKRLNAGIYLVNSSQNKDEKINLAISTISKAENYFHEALQKVKEAKSQGMDVSKILIKMKDSSKKHKQELKNLKQKVPSKFKEDFGREEKRVEGFEKDLEILR